MGKLQLRVLITALAFLLIACTNSGTSSGKIPMEQKYLFEVSVHNHAWGHVNYGIHIDRQGRVYGYDLSRLDWREEEQYFTEDSSYSEAILEEKFSNNKQYFQTIDAETLAEMVRLIAPASLGPFTEPKDTARDAGATTYVAFLYDEGRGKYKEVLLYQWGDWTIENTSEEAKTLHSWLYGIDTNPYQLYQEGLELAIRRALGRPVGPILDSDMNGLTRLSISGSAINDIGLLENYPNLQTLIIRNSEISDISPSRNLLT